MLPNWINENNSYIPIKGNNSFSVKTIKNIGKIMSSLKVQRGHEKKHSIPALLKLVFIVLFIVFLSIIQSKIIILGALAILQLYLCLWPGKDILSVLKTSVLAGLISLLIFTPAMIMNPDGIQNNLTVVAKVFCSVEILEIFNHTTQWNHITTALRKLKVPGVFVFTLDITLKYIVLLGNLILDLLTSMNLRSVGKNNKKYQSIGGVMGVTFVRSTEMSKELHDAMICRGYTIED